MEISEIDDYVKNLNLNCDDFSVTKVRDIVEKLNINISDFINNIDLIIRVIKKF